MSKFRFFVTALVVSLCTSLAIARGYNEIQTENNKVYPHYEEHYENWLQLSKREKSEYLKKSKQAFKGDNLLDPMPRVLNGEEYDNVLKRESNKGTGFNCLLKRPLLWS